MNKYFLQRVRSFKYAYHGIKLFIRKGINIKIQIIIAFLTLLLGLFFHVNLLEWVVLLFCIALVITLEAMNSSIEILTDMVSPDKNKKAGQVKDIAAGAVLFASIISSVIGVLIFLPKFLNYLSR